MSYYPGNQPQGGGYPSQQGQAPPPQGYGQHPPSHSPYPQQGYNQPPMQNQGYPPQGYPPQQQQQQQQQWNQAPPPAQYGSQPPVPQYPPPQQQQWSQPPGQYGSAPPPLGQYGAPPAGQYGAPGQYGSAQPPPGQYGAPPAGQFGAPPPGQYGSAQPPPGQFGMPPAAQYGAPPPGQYNAPQGAPTPPSLGYSFQQTGHINVTSQIEALYKAMKGFGTNEGVLITTLSSLDPIQVNAVREQYSARYHKDLIKHLESETSGDFEAALVAIARGPLIGDCWALKNATKGLGTKEQILDDVLVGRSNADMNAIKTEYQKIHHTPLEADLKSDLSAATETMFLMITAAKRNEDSVPVIPQQIDQDVRELQDSFGNMVTKNAEKACQILTSRNDAQIRAIAQKYEEQYRQSFSKTIEKTFSGHMEKTLLLLVARAQNRAKSDAIQLEQAMAGPGTKDTLLIQRVVRAHWDRQHMQRVRHEYQILYRKDLIKRIDGETSGYYKKLLIACVS